MTETLVREEDVEAAWEQVVERPRSYYRSDATLKMVFAYEDTLRDRARGLWICTYRMDCIDAFIGAMPTRKSFDASWLDSR